MILDPVDPEAPPPPDTGPGVGNPAVVALAEEDDDKDDDEENDGGDEPEPEPGSDPPRPVDEPTKEVLPVRLASDVAAAGVGGVKVLETLLK
jgi:hypothetical protein